MLDEVQTGNGRTGTYFAFHPTASFTKSFTDLRIFKSIPGSFGICGTIEKTTIVFFFSITIF